MGSSATAILAGIDPAGILADRLVLPRAGGNPRALPGFGPVSPWEHGDRDGELHGLCPPRSEIKAREDLEYLLEGQTQGLNLLLAEASPGLRLLPEPLDVPAELVDHWVALRLSWRRLLEPLSELRQPGLDPC